MSPPRRGARGAASSREARDARSKKEEPEPPKLTLNPGAGWTLENYSFLKVAPKDKLVGNIYKIFGIPLMYKSSVEHPAIQVLVEFHETSLTFAQQFTDAGKALMALMILTDYIGNVPAFGNSQDSFNQWIERSARVIQNSEFTPVEQQVIMSYINNNLRANSHILHFVISHQAMQRLDSEGLKLFHPVIPIKTEHTDEADQSVVTDSKPELEAQLAAAAAERGAAEEARRKLEMQQALEAIVSENLVKLKAAVDARNDVLLQQIVMIEERLEGKPVRRS
jgi:hypothetical protein